MKGVAIAITAFILISSLAFASVPLEEPVQYGQYCDDQKVSGSGIIDISTSMIDKRLALEYDNAMAGEGDFELASEQSISDIAMKNVQDGKSSNFFETSKLTYSGLTPLIGGKLLRSKAFYGGLGAVSQEAFRVMEMEGERKSHLGSTVTATSAHLLGFDTKGSFNGTFTTDSSWHKIFSKDINSHQGFSGQFEMDRQVKFHEKATYPSRIELAARPPAVVASVGDSISCGYEVRNAADTVVSGLSLEGEAPGGLEAASGLNRTALGPGEVASGVLTYTVTEEDVLAGPRVINATVTGTDNLGDLVSANAGTLLVPDAIYYPGGAVTPSAEAGWALYPDAFDLTGAGITLYLMDVNMTQSFGPPPACPYTGCPAPSYAAQVLFGMTNSSALFGLEPAFSAWQSLTLDYGLYQGAQAFKGGDGNVSPGPAITWDTPYAGTEPNGGFYCTGDPGYDSFDLKMVVEDMGPSAGLMVTGYQRVHMSTETAQPGLEWRLLGSQEIPETALDKGGLKPFVLVGNRLGAGGTISWPGLIAVS